MNTTTQIDTWIAEHGSCRDALNVALARLELALLALGEVEYVWVPSGYGTMEDECPWCKEYREDGHSSDCARQIALTLPGEN